MSAVALAWIGSPFWLMSIVTTAALERSLDRVHDTVTLPTSTPAIRTGEAMCSCGLGS